MSDTTTVDAYITDPFICMICGDVVVPIEPWWHECPHMMVRHD